MPVYVPHLREKLAQLYKSGRNPAVINAATLAAEIGVVAPQITNFINGNAVRRNLRTGSAESEPRSNLANPSLRHSLFGGSHPGIRPSRDGALAAVFFSMPDFDNVYFFIFQEIFNPIARFAKRYKLLSQFWVVNTGYWMT
jgi:hypothetical protein